MGHRLPAAGVPTRLSEHFRFYQVTPPETRCTNENRTRPGDCTLRPKFIARTVLRPAPDTGCCPDRENFFTCCSKKKPAVDSDRAGHVRRSDGLRCVELRPLEDLRQDLCQFNSGQGASIGTDTFGDRKRKNFIGKLEDCCPAVVRKPYVLWKREPHCRHLGTTYCDATREKQSLNTECQGSDPVSACATKCNDYCDEQTCLPVNHDVCCCQPQEKITFMCPTVEYVPVVKADSRPTVPFYGKTNPNFTVPAQMCAKADRPKVCCIQCP